MRAVPRLCGFYPGICRTTEEKARKNLSQGKKNLSRVKKNLRVQYTYYQNSIHITKKIYILPKQYTYYQNSIHINKKIYILQNSTHMSKTMMGGVSPKTCWTIKKHWNNKFYYTVPSCWFFLWDLYYDARIHEHQKLSTSVAGTWHDVNWCTTTCSISLMLAGSISRHLPCNWPSAPHCSLDERQHSCNDSVSTFAQRICTLDTCINIVHTFSGITDSFIY